MAEFSVSRRRHVAAPAETVHALVVDFRAWPRWSPWEGPDDQLERTYSGSEKGVGARYAWKGDTKAGAGHMEIVEATPARIVVPVTFTAPFESENTSIFEIAPVADGGCEVTWTMTGPQSQMQRILFTLMRMNAKVARDFDTGLAALAAAAEGTTDSTGPA